jgi:hypothetical protein
MQERLAIIGVALIAIGCGSAARHESVVPLPPSTRSASALELETVEIDPGEWKQIAHVSRSNPCDAKAKHVAHDRLALVNEAFRRSGHAELTADCDPDSASFTAGGRAHDVDHVRAEVEEDANGKYVRFLALSVRTGFVATGLIHTAQHESTDGILVSDIQRWLPQQLGRVFFVQSGPRKEIFITGKGAEKRGIYLVAPIRLDQEYSLGIARFVVKE